MSDACRYAPSRTHPFLESESEQQERKQRDLFSLCNTYFVSHRTNACVYVRDCVCVAEGFCVVLTPSNSPLSHIVWTASPLPCSAPFASAPYVTPHSLCMRASRPTHAVLVALWLLLTRSLFSGLRLLRHRMSLKTSLTVVYFAFSVFLFFFVLRVSVYRRMPVRVCVL